MRVQFSDAGMTQIVSYFGCPQDAAVFPNQGDVETNDPRWAAYYASVPESARFGLPAPTSP